MMEGFLPVVFGYLCCENNFKAYPQVVQLDAIGG